MKYIIWGAGAEGKQVFERLGPSRVACFADKNKYGGEYLKKPIISFQEMVEKAKGGLQFVVVVASSVYQEEMREMLENESVKNYFVFSRDDYASMDSLFPFYSIYGMKKYATYNSILSAEQVSRFNRIVIYGTNRLLPHLLCEIMIQSPHSDISVAKQSVPEWGCNTLGFPVEEFSFDNDHIDCLILNVRHNKDDIRNKFRKCDLPYKVIDIYDADELDCANQYSELERFRNIHMGKRGFVVATGPSLKIDDLDTLHRHHEICISVNKAYRVYDRTMWRADYMGIGDPKALDDIDMNISEMPGEWFIGDNTYHVDGREKISGINYFHFKLHGFLPFCPRFSEDFSKGTFWGGTITFDFGLQFAHFLGLKEIYIIGADNSFGKVTDSNNHFIPDYFSKEEAKNDYVPYHEKEINLAYESAERYSRENGFRIFNATRGGKLEAFERVNFDDLFG